MYCESKNKFGQPCKASALAGSNFCFFHSPASSERRRAAQSKGGRGNKPIVTLVPDCDFKLGNRQELTETLASILNRLDTRIGPRFHCGQSAHLR